MALSSLGFVMAGLDRGSLIRWPGQAKSSPADLVPLKGITLMVNSLCNGWRFENAWLDK
jgi:hypothetical protein